MGYAKFKHFNEQFYLGVCHRGLHDETSTENSLGAFKKAIDKNMAFELDVHLTKDDVVVVCHDSDLERVTGKKGIIEQLTFKQLRDDYRLLDGSFIPSLQEVIELNNEKCLIVVELKVYEGNYKELAEKTKKVLEQIKDNSKIIIISFDPRALIAFGKDPYRRQLLLCEEHEKVKASRFVFESLDVDKRLVKESWVQDLRKKGGIVNVWTIESEEELIEYGEYADTITFQGFDPNIVIENREEFLKKRAYKNER